MRVLVWIVTWVVLLLGAGAYLWALVRVAWRRTRDFGTELRVTEQRLSDVRGHVERPRKGTDAFQALAVFGNASVLRAERRDTRQALSEQRRARQAQNLPTWARRVDS